MRTVELTDIQGNILRGYNQPHFRYVYYRIHDCDQGRRFLKRIVDQTVSPSRYTLSATADRNGQRTNLGIVTGSVATGGVIEIPFTL